jgi:2-polyprenyl-6-methoxyphenol hydroxylase-like FAD-dependent oxidoreductase
LDISRITCSPSPILGELPNEIRTVEFDAIERHGLRISAVDPDGFTQAVGSPRSTTVVGILRRCILIMADNVEQQPSEESFDVAIVGYGPVGQALALKLAQQGHRIAVIERRPSLYGLPRAVGLDHEAMRILQSLGIAEEFAPGTTLSSVYEWQNGEGTLLVAFPGLDQVGPSGWPVGNGFHQPTLESILNERVCNEQTGRVVVLQGWTVVDVTEACDHVLLDVRGAGENASAGRRVSPRYVVGCDGAGSMVRQSMGVAYDDLAFAADWLVMDLKPNDPLQCSTSLIQVCDPQRPTTMVTAGPGRRRFEFMMLAGESKEDFNNPKAAWELLGRWGWTPENAVLERHAVYTFRASIADAWHRGRVLIAGDAAHLTPPFAAQGLCAGLRDVAALAWRLDLVLRDQAQSGLLTTYSDERKEHARALVEFAVELGRIICVLDPEHARARDAGLRAQAEKLAQQKMPSPRLGSSLLMRDADPNSGTLGRQGRVQLNGRVGLFDDLVGTGFVLIGHDHDPTEFLGDDQRAFLGRVGATVVGVGARCTVQDLDGTYKRWFEEIGCESLLVRPDFYVYGAGKAGELVDDLMAALAASGNVVLQKEAA